MESILLAADKSISIEVGPALAALLATLITSIFAAITSWLAYRRADQARAQAEATAVKTEATAADAKVARDDMKVDLKEIHKAVNSTSERMASDLKETQQRVVELSKLLAEAHTSAADVVPPPAEPPKAMHVEEMEVGKMTVKKE